MSGLTVIAGSCGASVSSIVSISSGAASVDAATGNQLTFSHTTPPGNNRRLILLAMSVGDAAPSGSYGTYGEVVGVQKITSSGVGTPPIVTIAVYELSDPPVGTADLTTLFNVFSGTPDIAAIAFGVNDARQYDPDFGYWNMLLEGDAAESGTTISRDLSGVSAISGETLTLAASDLVLFCAAAAGDQILVPVAGLTEIASVSAPNDAGTLTGWWRRADDLTATPVGYTRDEDTNTAFKTVVIGTEE